MDQREGDRGAVAGLALLRLGFAAWFLARPDAPAGALGRPPSPGLRRVALAVAVRELVLGVGTAAALLRRRPTGGWVTAMAVADAVNGTTTAVAGLRGAVPARRAAGLAAFDLSGTVSELWLAQRLRRAACSGDCCSPGGGGPGQQAAGHGHRDRRGAVVDAQLGEDPQQV